MSSLDEPYVSGPVDMAVIFDTFDISTKNPNLAPGIKGTAA